MSLSALTYGDSFSLSQKLAILLNTKNTWNTIVKTLSNAHVYMIMIYEKLENNIIYSIPHFLT
jgi:hypothetical protein